MKSTVRVITGEKPLAPRHLLPDIASVCLCHMGTERCPRWSQTPGRQPGPAKQMWADVRSLTSSQHRKLNCRADKTLPAIAPGMISQAALREGQRKQKVARRTWKQSRAVCGLGMRVRAGAPLSATGMKPQRVRPPALLLPVSRLPCYVKHLNQVTPYTAGLGTTLFL